ncbi:SDR family NAD(P)-dependent oxidoreductase [Bacilliculturomica massiliensis]|uniref:SDR family NAD(P)-dependent oxidoreductase n=1 Tax=Bacilliculturomica massiliensis TaxID=1917867 RepID=UPI001031426E|nr:SDR family NAD(P)-dependent oxidoreductase [Bacilliculturomica massiliensis]
MIFTAKRALVTGGAQGIGLAIAEKLAAEGLQVIITDVNGPMAAEQAEHLSRKFRRSCASVKMDVSDREEVDAAAAFIRESHGPVDVLVNNAGICYPARALDEITEEEWLRVFRINVLGMVNCVNAFVGPMKEKQFGKIVNMASSSGFTGGISVSASYAVSKAGVMALTKNMAKQFGAFQINVNALSPGIIASAMTADLTYDMDTLALPRFGEVADVANLAAFLASDEASYLTGTTVDINGGLYMR